MDRQAGTRTRIAVVGGGLAGLAAAAHAARAGATVTVLERASAAGGRAQTQEEQGFLFNLGPHALYPPSAAMLRELGIEARGRPPRVGGLALYRGRNHRLPVSAGSVLRTGLLDAADKVALGKALASLSRADPAVLAAVPLSAYLEQLTGRERVRDLLGAFVRIATYSHAPGLLSAGAAVAQFRLGTGVLYVDGGWRSLVDALAGAAWDAGATIHLGTRVEAVEPAGEGVGLRFAAGHAERFDAVILAGGPRDVARLLPGGARERFEAGTARLTPVRAAVLDLGLSRLPNPRITFGAGIDEPLYLSVHSTWAKLAPAGGALVHLARYLGPGEDSPPARLRAELEAWADRAQPGWRELVVARRFMPALTVVHALVEAGTGGLTGRPGIGAAGVPGVFIAGDWVGPEGMLADAALASAKAAASAALGLQQARAPEAVAV